MTVADRIATLWHLHTVRLRDHISEISVAQGEVWVSDQVSPRVLDSIWPWAFEEINL